MSKNTELDEDNVRSLARMVRTAEDGVLCQMNAFIAAEDARGRLLAVAKITQYEQVKAELLGLVSKLPEKKLREFIGLYTCARIDDQGAKLAAFADKLAREVKAVVVPEASAAPEPPLVPGQPIIVVCQEWEESEVGWGIRPDGFSMHLNYEDCKNYIAKFWQSMPKEVPDEYSRPLGEPYVARISSDSKWYTDLGIAKKDGRLGVRYYERQVRPEKV